MFYEERNAFDAFVKPEVYTQCVLVSTTECKHNFVCKKAPQGIFKHTPKKHNL